jgi:5-methylcytosine-specific restriction endonuclease McrA
MPYLKKPRRPAYLPERKKRKPTGDSSFYNKTAWRKTSRRYRQQNVLCEVCTSINVLEPATLTDHIIGRQFGGADYAPRNLMAMCASHHNSKSIKERYGLFLDTVDTPAGLVPSDRSQVIDVLTSDK